MTTSVSGSALDPPLALSIRDSFYIYQLNTLCDGIHAVTQISFHACRRSLRSVGTNRPIAPPVKLSTVGSRAFPVVGPQIWNDLPEDVTSAESLSTFRRRLKTHFFMKSFPGGCFLDTNLVLASGSRGSFYYFGHLNNYDWLNDWCRRGCMLVGTVWFVDIAVRQTLPHGKCWWCQLWARHSVPTEWYGTVQ